MIFSLSVHWRRRFEAFHSREKQTTTISGPGCEARRLQVQLLMMMMMIFFQAIVNSSYVGHAKAGDRSHRGGKRATNPAALKTSPTTHTSSEPNDAPMSAAKMPQQTGHEEKNTGLEDMQFRNALHRQCTSPCHDGAVHRFPDKREIFVVGLILDAMRDGTSEGDS